MWFVLATTRVEFNNTNVHMDVIYNLLSRKQKTREQLCSYASMLDFEHSVSKNKS
jgi:hypothetical protein